MIGIEDRLKKWQRGIGVVSLVWVFGLPFVISGRIAHAIPNGGYAHPEVLIQPEELKILIDKKDPHIRIIDIREKLKYLAGHIPGAVHVWRPDIVDKNHPIPGMMAPNEQMESLLGNLGVSEKDTIIINSDGPDNGRLWWILAYYGFPLHQMRILDGGLDGWKARGYPTEMLPPKTEKTLFRLPKEEKFRKPMLCTLPEVRSALGKRDKVVLDVRSQKEFLGEDLKEGAIKPGRIPGVVWIEWTETLVDKDPFKNFWKSAEEIKRIYMAKGVTPDKDIFMYWHSGVRSAHSLVSLYLVGYPMEKLHNYDGSWIEWSRSQEAIETGSPNQWTWGVKMIRIPESVFNRMVEHAEKESPLECCGILGGKGHTVEKVFELQNAEKSSIRYTMSPQEQMRVFEELEKGAMEMVAIYHSHPQTIPFPSETDVKLAFYPEVASIIISLKEKEPVVKAFRIGKEAIYLEEMEILPQL